MRSVDLQPVKASFQPEESQLNLREYFLVIAKRRWFIVGAVILAVTIGTIQTLRQTPLFLSTAVMYIDRLTYNIVPEVVTESWSYQGYDAFFQTQYRLLKSKSLSERVVQRLNLTPSDLMTPEQKRNLKTPPKVIVSQDELENVSNQLLGMVNINPVKGTTLCEVSFVSADPELSMILANAWADEYVEYSLSSQQEYTEKAEQLLVGQVKSLQMEIAEKEKMLQDYSLEKQVLKFDDKPMSVTALEGLNESLSTAIQSRVTAEVQYTDFSRRGKSASEVLDHPTVQKLRDQLQLQQNNYQLKSKFYKPDYPEMVRLKSEMNQTEQQLDKEISIAYSRLLQSKRSEYEKALSSENAIHQQIDSLKRETIEEGRKESNYDRLKLELDDKKRLLSTILAKQSETGVSAQVKEKKATTIRIVDRARKPRAPFKPNLRQNVYYSFAIGLLIGIALVFGLEYLDRSFKNVEDVQRYVQLPFLGVVPRYAGESNGGNGHHRAVMKQEGSERSPSEAIDLLMVHNPESVASEAFRSVRTSLLLAFPEAPPRSILVTSSHPSEGKTFIAANMAISLAQLEKQVALVDGDMRNPRIHRIWGQQNNSGLSRYLTSDVSATEVITPSNISGVSLITSGMKTPRPAELLASKRMDELLEELEDQFDHVIVDSPPVMLLADAVILASKCSCVLFVIQGGVTTRDVVQKAKQKLSAADAAMAGVVLNNVDLNDPYYYYSYYSRYGYQYKSGKKRARSKSA